jgi:uncharacterized protein YjbJ (UPF0337 family)
MDRNRIEGAGREMAGRIKEAVGKLTGDQKLKAEGKVKKTAGKVQNAAGGAVDSVRDRERDRRS